MRIMRILNKYSWRCKFKMMVEVRGGDQDEVEEQNGDQADDFFWILVGIVFKVKAMIW